MALGRSEEPHKNSSPETKRKIATLAVATGEGLSALFREIGSDNIISCAETSAPTVLDFIHAFRECDAEHIIVLPNSKSALVVACRAAELYGDSEVHVLPTVTLVQGYAALLAIPRESYDIEALLRNAARAASEVLAGEIVYVSRDIPEGERRVKHGEYISITNGKITSISDSSEGALFNMLESVENLKDYAVITLFVGNEVTDEERVAVTEKIGEIYPELQLQVYIGGQEIYHYYISLE